MVHSWLLLVVFGQFLGVKLTRTTTQNDPQQPKTDQSWPNMTKTTKKGWMWPKKKNDQQQLIKSEQKKPTRTRPPIKSTNCQKRPKTTKTASNRPSEELQPKPRFWTPVRAGKFLPLPRFRTLVGAWSQGEDSVLGGIRSFSNSHENDQKMLKRAGGKWSCFVSYVRGTKRKAPSAHDSQDWGEKMSTFCH